MNSRPIELDKQLLHRIAVARLFHEITDDLGLVEAQQIFATFCVPMTAKERAGPSGSTDPIVLDKHIRRLINKRKAERLARRM
jgi:hypothetical protein